MKMVSRLFAILFILCVLIVGIYLTFPGVFPQSFTDQVESIVDTGTQAYEELSSTGSDPSVEVLPSGMLEELHRNGELIGEESSGCLEDSGITGDGYTFDPIYYPYYGFLTDTEKAFYVQIYANVMQMQTTFVPTAVITAESAEKTITALLYDHPELFWLESGYQYRYTSDGICVQIIMQFNDAADSIESKKQLFECSAAYIIEEAQKLATDYEKEKYVHDTLISSISYNVDAPLNQSAYSALVNGETVCAGYSKAFQYIMTKLGIPTYFCVGYSEGDHAWNIVIAEPVPLFIKSISY